MGITQIDMLTGLNKEQTAIALLQAFEPPEGYYLAFSGGKDSVVIYDLATKAGVKFDAHYCVSPIDPPEVHRFIRDYYPQVAWDYHARGFWKLVYKKGLPLRQARWCCRYIKEAGGKGRVLIVGNRRGEGRGGRRKYQNCFEQVKEKFFVRPIIDWTGYLTKEGVKAGDVWEYIKTNNLECCSLYDEGQARIGCVLCPFTRNSEEQIERFPKIAKLWRLSCDHIMERRLAKGNATFKTGQELWDWWISRK